MQRIQLLCQPGNVLSSVLPTEDLTILPRSALRREPVPPRLNTIPNTFSWSAHASTPFRNGITDKVDAILRHPHGFIQITFVARDPATKVYSKFPPPPHSIQPCPTKYMQQIKDVGYVCNAYNAPYESLDLLRSSSSSSSNPLS
jgi:hypothetical protein